MKNTFGFLVGSLSALMLSMLLVSGASAASTCALQSGKAYRTVSSPAVYYITDTCTKRPIKNPDVFFSHFTSWKDVVVTAASNLAAVPNDPLSFLPWGTLRTFRDGSLVKTVNDPKVYFVSNGGQLYPIASEQVFADLGLSWSWVEDVVPAVVSSRVVGSPVATTNDYPSGLFFKYSGSPQVYAIIHASTGIQKMPIDAWSIVENTYRPDHIVVFPNSRVVPDQSPTYANVPPAQPTTPAAPTTTPPASVVPPVTTPAVPGTVSTVADLRSAVAGARPGTVITLAPGTYDLAGIRITTAHDGTSDAPITIRAATAGQVTVVTNGAEEAFQVSNPYYIFENLAVQVRGAGSYHAYKIDTNGHNTIIRGGSMLVYKGGESGVKGSGNGFGAVAYPDNVTIENTDISFTEPTNYAVAEGIDAVGVHNWTIRGNTIHGIKIASTDSVAWGVVIKGNSEDTLIEQNTFYDNDVAISIGGSTALQYIRGTNGDYEHRRATVRNNVSIGTRDVALYIERGVDTHIFNNTFINSASNGAGATIDVRYTVSTADVRGNVLDKPIRDRDNASHTASYNVIMANQFDVTDFQDVAAHDLRPKPGSRLFTAIVDTGIPIDQVTVDRSGVHRPQGVNNDIGAYETSAPTLSLNTPPTPPTPTPTVGVASLSLTREDATGLPGMYAGTWGAADFDGDGLPDLVVYGHYRTMYHSSDNPTGGSDELRLYKNISTVGGAIKFALQQVVPDNNGNRGAYVVIGDFDGNNRPDFAVQTRNGGRGAGFLNNGNWSFTRRELPFENGSATFVMAAADVNRDGRDDLIFAGDGGVNAGLWYSLNSASTAWEPHQTDFSHRLNYGATMAAGDLTGDGYPDFVVGGNASTPFGNHDCTGATPITSGARLQYGQANKNLGGTNGFDMTPLAIVGAFGYKVPEATRHDLTSCHGMDNAQMLIRDLDNDGKNDVIITGSSTGQDGPVGLNGQQYDFAVLFNDGTGANYTIWENTGPQNANGGTNGGVGNLDFPSIAVGDLTGDGLPDIFVEGHRRDFSVANYPYIYEDLLFVNNGNRTFSQVSLANYLPTFDSGYPLPSGLGFLASRTRYVAEGGDLMADFNHDGKADLLFSGAELPYHTNGINYRDYNTTSTLATYVLRNTK